MIATDLPVRVRARHRQGRCYELAGKGIIKDGADEWALVHGTLQTPNLGPMPHAWCERRGFVYDPVLDSVYDATEYAARWQAVVHARYDRLTACRLVGATGSWGPWHDQLDRAA